jgi:hypothetical protein
MTDLFKLILGILASRFKARATLEAENLILRQQVNVLRRRTPKRPKDICRTSQSACGPDDPCGA